MKSIFDITTKGCVLLIFYTLSQNSNAQIWNKMGNKIKQKIENQADKRIERRIDETIDKNFDRLEENTEKSIQKNKTTKASSDNLPKESEESNWRLMVDMYNTMNEPIDLPDTYQFKLGIRYQTSSSELNNKKPETGEFTLWFSKNLYTGFQTKIDGDITMVLDQGNIITFMEKNKTYTAFNPSAFAINVNNLDLQNQQVTVDETKESPFVSIKKIGTENILGYSCDIYHFVVSENRHSKVWVTNKINQVNNSYIEALSSFGGKYGSIKNLGIFSKVEKDIIKGTMLKVVSLEEDSQTAMIAQEIYLSGKTIQCKEYKNISMSSED